MSSNTNPRKTIDANKGIVNPTRKFSSRHSKRKGQDGVRLVVWEDDQGQIREFELSGHAGYAEEGRDIVCAGVSALSIAAVNGLERFLTVAPKVETRDGYISCQLIGEAEQDLEKAQLILQTMVLGIEQIQADYSEKYILIDRRRWTPC